jgi:hypothetical protein
VKRRLSVFFLTIFLSIAPSARADNAPAKPAKQPIGVFASDDGTTIIVGIGTTKPLATLDVSRGELKIGSTGASCSATLAGRLRYAAAKLQLCDGAGWRNVSLDKAQ